MLDQTEIDELNAEGYSHFLAYGDPVTIPIQCEDDWALDLYTREDLVSLGGNDYLSDGDLRWNSSLASTMLRTMTSGC